MKVFNKSKIKICGIKEVQTLDCCIENKVDFFGLIFYKKSSRNIAIGSAQSLLKYSEKKKISSVGVFVNEYLDDLIDLLKKLNFDYIQLHGNEDNQYIKSIKKKGFNIIKNISIKTNEDLKKTFEFPDSDFFLFDYKPNHNELPGGNAKKFNWDIIKDIKINKPWFLSGGININNINKIKNFTIPYGIDISSGVEDKPGIKDNNKIKSLLKFYE
jgi:phosphoribosylanthranilate isomerase